MNRKWFSMFSIKIIASFTMVLDQNPVKSGFDCMYCNCRYAGGRTD